MFGQMLKDEHKRHPHHDLELAIQVRLTRLSLRTSGSGGVMAQWINLVRRTPSVRWKKHGVVVSNTSLANYRGASLPVETPIAEQVIMALDDIEREIEHCSRAFKRYLFGRLAQALNEHKPHTPETLVTCLVSAASLALQASDCPNCKL